MALCINDSGTYRNITTLCINDSGTYRNITTGCINQAGTYRLFGFLALGNSYEGGFLICKAAPLRWVVSPRSAEVSREWNTRNNANTRAQEVSGCSGWFVPNIGQLQNPGFICRGFWDSYSNTYYWSSNDRHGSGCGVCFTNGNADTFFKHRSGYCARAFRCVTY